jgi:predicted alpha/beta hydrolase
MIDPQYAPRETWGSRANSGACTGPRGAYGCPGTKKSVCWVGPHLGVNQLFSNEISYALLNSNLGFHVLSLSYPLETTPEIMPASGANFRIQDWGRQAATTVKGGCTVRPTTHCSNKYVKQLY